MAEARPFRGLRYDSSAADPALTIAPPYDVISPAEQRALYERSAHNIVRIEYGEQRDGDDAANNRYTRAAHDLVSWRDAGVLRLDGAAAIYGYRQEFTWGGERYSRQAWFAAVRLEPWDAGVVKPHEHTLSNPKADRMSLLRATQTQVSPVYCIFRERDGAVAPTLQAGVTVTDCEADGQRHVLTAISDAAAIGSFGVWIASSDVYIADGHHRYETALAYREEVRATRDTWTGEEPENFVLMALTQAADPGLLVLPTHRIVRPPVWPVDGRARIERHFRIEEMAASEAQARLANADVGTVLAVAGLERGRVHLLTLTDRAGIESTMPAEQPDAWRRLDVSVLQFGILRDVFGIDDAVLAAGTAVTYTQDGAAAIASVADGSMVFLLRATPVEQVLAVADVGGRMPQKSTYFYPKLPTGLVMHALA